MGYTKFGEFMRVRRIRNHETMSNTAKLFGVTLPFVSAVENGKKNVPENWIPVIIAHYNLSDDEIKELTEAVECSQTQVKLNLISATPSQRKLVSCFQRSLGNLDDETASAIINLINKENS